MARSLKTPCANTGQIFSNTNLGVALESSQAFLPQQIY
jgi:hypothetical protein